MKKDFRMALMLYAAIFSAVLGMFQFGFNTGAINSPSEAIKNFINESYIDEDNVNGFSREKVDTLFSLAVGAFLVGFQSRQQSKALQTEGHQRISNCL